MGPTVGSALTPMTDFWRSLISFNSNQFEAPDLMDQGFLLILIETEHSRGKGIGGDGGIGNQRCAEGSVSRFPRPRVQDMSEWSSVDLYRLLVIPRRRDCFVAHAEV